MAKVGSRKGAKRASVVAKGVKKATRADAKGSLAAHLMSLAAVSAPVIPVDRLVGEARAVRVAASADRAALVRVGLDWKLAALLPDAATALSQEQAKLLQVVRTQRSKREVELEQAGIVLRSTMIADGQGPAGVIDGHRAREPPCGATGARHEARQGAGA